MCLGLEAISTIGTMNAQSAARSIHSPSIFRSSPSMASKSRFLKVRRCCQTLLSHRRGLSKFGGRSRGHREASLAGPLWRYLRWQGHSPFLARLDQGLGHCPKLIQCLLGGIPPSHSALQGRDLRQVHPAFALLRFVKNVVQLVDVHLFSSGSGVVDGEVSSIVLWWSFSVKRPAVRMVVVRSQAEVNPPVTQQIGGVDLIGSGVGGTGQLHYRGCPGVRDGVDTPSPYPTATCPPVGWSNG